MNAFTPTWPLTLHFDPERSGRREKRVRSTVVDQPRREPRLLCVTCRHVITYPILRVSTHGNHAHTCTNPQGITFLIGCFRDAAGCKLAGQSTTEHSWFPGYRWRIALCARCQTHLGWRFESSEDRFYGLILDRLIQEQPSDDRSGDR